MKANAGARGQFNVPTGWDVGSTAGVIAAAKLQTNAAWSPSPAHLRLLRVRKPRSARTQCHQSDRAHVTLTVSDGKCGQLLTGRIESARTKGQTTPTAERLQDPSSCHVLLA